MHVALPDENIPEPHWESQIFSQHLACEQCGQGFERLTPHNFSFNSSLGWCSACDGLGTQTGANPTALLKDKKLTLEQGALQLWPNLDNAVSRRMLESMARDTGLALDIAVDQLPLKHRRLIFHGAGERWFDVRADETAADKKAKRSGKLLFRFQYKGLYPALEEASRLSGKLRQRLEQFVDEVECSACGGSRLREDASSVRFQGLTIGEVCRLPLGTLQQKLTSWKLDTRQKRIAGEVIREVRNRVQFLNDVGLEYVSLGRTAATLSNGEAQRIRLASQLGSGLCGVLYVLDEPTIGLHPRDNTRLLKALHRLRDLGNTLLIVEHDREVIDGSDYLCDFGPGAGRGGGNIVAAGTPKQVARRKGSVTGPYLAGRKAIAIPLNRRPADAKKGNWLKIIGARHNNLRNIDVGFPLRTLTAVTGPSGSGKSSLVDEVLFNSLSRTLHRSKAVPGAHDEIQGLELVNKVIRVDQQPLGNSPTSNPATYTGVFEFIRMLFAQLPESKLRGFTPRRYSFNVAGGRCDDCEGNGQICVEMHFLPDVWVTCETCQGSRYNPETLAVKYRGHSISDVLELTCGEAVELFANIPKVRRILQTLCDVGLDYLTLGQSAPTLSGGEAQRVKLAAELSRPDTGQTIYLLDEPTTGLHFDDLRKLLEVLQRLVDLGNTVVVIEHNLDVIKAADWIIDMGPEAGEEGGLVVAQGTPEAIVAEQDAASVLSHTAVALAPVLSAGPLEERALYVPGRIEKKRGELDITEVGKDAQMPWELDGRQWHTESRVDRKGGACRWEGRILGEVVDRIHQLGKFAETNWNARSVVEIAAQKKSDGWFFHAITGETWLLKLKFRVAKGTFDKKQLQSNLPLPTLNEMDELPVYGNEPRVKVRGNRGHWQEVEIRVYNWAEVDQPEFWSFLEEAAASFLKATASIDVAELTPWKVLGQKWHFMRKGFPRGKSVLWDTSVLEHLHEMLRDLVPDGHFIWTNRQLVHLYLQKKDKHPWVSFRTKHPTDVVLALNGPRNGVSLGRISGLGRERDVIPRDESRDTLRILIRQLADLKSSEFEEFLREHLQLARGAE